MIIRKALVAAWLPTALVAVWATASAIKPSIYFPKLGIILTHFQANWLFSRFGEDVVPTLTTFAIGYVLAVAAGCVVGLALASLSTLEQIVDPFLQFMRALPSIALVPIILVFIGIGIESKIIVVALGSLWPVLLNTIDGIRSMEPELKRTAISYKMPSRVYVTKIMLPAATPNIMAGARVSLAIALVLTVGSELYAASSGVGHFILQAQQSFAIVDMWTGILLLGILGYMCTSLFALLERKLLHWTR